MLQVTRRIPICFPRVSFGCYLMITAVASDLPRDCRGQKGQNAVLQREMGLNQVAMAAVKLIVAL